MANLKALPKLRELNLNRTQIGNKGLENLQSTSKLQLLLLNGAECEPYLTCDDRVMREHAEEVQGVGMLRFQVHDDDPRPQPLQAHGRLDHVFKPVDDECWVRIGPGPWR